MFGGVYFGGGYLAQGTLAREASFSQAVGGTVTPTGSVSYLKIVLQTLVGSVTPESTLGRAITRTLVGSVTGTSAVYRLVVVTITGHLNSIRGEIVKRTGRTLSGDISSSGDVVATNAFIRLLTGSVSSIGIINRAISRQLFATITPVGIVRKLIQLFIFGLVEIAGIINQLLTSESTTIVRIGGVVWDIQYDTLEIEDQLNELPNQCSFQTRVRPVEGQIVSILRGNTNTVEFYGNILTIEQISQEKPENLLFSVTCQDPTWKFNRRLVTRRWINQSASTIAIDILNGYTTGFSAANVVLGLPVIPEFECVLEQPTSALARLVSEFAGNFYIDYASSLHLFITEVTNSPDDLLLTTPFDELVYQTDLGQIRTRVKGVGGGSTATIDLMPGTTSAPVNDATPFEPTGGLFISGANVGTYTSKHDGGVASKVSSNVSSPGGSAPTAALAASVVGVVIGPKTYKVAFANSGGETIPGGISNSVTGVAFLPPVGGSVAAVSSLIGKLIGTYWYAITYVTNLGETTKGNSFGRVAIAATIPAAPSVNTTGSMGNLIGYYAWRVTFVAADDIETESSPNGERSCSAMSGPGSPTGWTHVVPGPLAGVYNWRVSFVTADGRESAGTGNGSSVGYASAPSAPSLSSSGAATISYRVSFFHPTWGETPWSNIATDTSSGGTTVVTVSGLPAGCGFKVYSTGTGFGPSSPFYHVGTVNPGLGSSYTHAGASGSEATSPTATLGCVVGMQIATGPSGTVSRRIYRTKPGGSIYYLCGEIPDNSTTTFWDGVPDWDLTTATPVANLNGQSINVTGIQTGPSGTLKRRLYRTQANGVIFGLLAEIPNNTTTSFFDNNRDDALNMGKSIPPGVSNAGQVHVISSIPVGPAGTLARRLYRTGNGGITYQLLVEIPDNSTTSYTDNTLDSQLGQETAPLINTAGANQIQLTNIPIGGAGVTQRILYRNALDGSYKYLDTIDNNSATTYLDNKDDTELGRAALTVSTIGASIGDTVLYLTSVVGLLSSGWMVLNGMLIKYTGISSNTLVGVPGPMSVSSITRSGSVATVIMGSHGFVTDQVVTIQGAVQPEYNGSHKIIVTGGTTFTYKVAGVPATSATGTIIVLPAGAILSPIKGDTPIVSAPFLSGVSGVSYSINSGNTISLYTIRDDATAQTVLAALEGGDGIHESTIEDSSLVTLAGLNSAADAELNNFKYKIPSISFESRDVKLRSGKTVLVNLTDERSISGNFLIQRVISSQFNFNKTTMPLRRVDAAPVRVAWQDFIKQQKIAP